MPSLLDALRTLVGLGANRTGHLEKWLSGAGGIVGILGVLLISQASLGLSGSASLVASMGASAVLLFAVPHGPLSQPWPLLGGHLVSAVIGVACAKVIAQPFITAALAVALAISAMHYLRCIHPPGGATALTAVAGGDAVHSLGFHYVLTPVLLNALTILLVAVLFNYPFPWRRYPARWARGHNRLPTTRRPAEPLSPGDVPAAAKDIGRTPNTSRDDSGTIVSLARRGGEAMAMQPADIRRGAYYCNGAFDSRWQVRRVIDDVSPRDPRSTADELLTYTVVAGAQRRHTGTATREAFARWASYEVLLNENSWQRVDLSPHQAPSGGD